MYQILIVAKGHCQILCTSPSLYDPYFTCLASLLYCRTLSLYRVEDSAGNALKELHHLDLNIFLLQFRPSIGILLTYKQHHCVELNFPNLTVYKTSYYAWENTDLGPHWSPLVTNCDPESLMVGYLVPSTHRCAHNIIQTPPLHSTHEQLSGDM